MNRPSIQNPLSALNQRQANDLASRRAASTILSPEAIGGKTSAAKLLSTTLGGMVRPITNADLVLFRKSAQALGSKLREGLIPQEIIDQSRPADRERARLQIRYAIPTRLRAGQALFVTDSGPESKVTRHFVTVAWPGYGAALSMPGTSFQAASELVKAPLKFDCDCEHHRYVYRYIVTAMGANAGRAETGYPKLTNSRLAGVACKHVLRVMVDLSSMNVRRMVSKMIEADRERINKPVKVAPRVIQASAADADRAMQGRKRAVFTTDERERRAAVAVIRKALPARTAGSTARDIEKTLVTLSLRPDIGAQAILRALQAVLSQPQT